MGGWLVTGTLIIGNRKMTCWRSLSRAVVHNHFIVRYACVGNPVKNQETGTTNKIAIGTGKNTDRRMTYAEAVTGGRNAKGMAEGDEWLKNTNGAISK